MVAKKVPRPIRCKKNVRKMLRFSLIILCVVSLQSMGAASGPVSDLRSPDELSAYVDPYVFFLDVLNLNSVIINDTGVSEWVNAYVRAINP